jgi:septum formation protein
MKIILASASPRRRELLNLIGIRPEIRIPSINEEILPGEPLEKFLERITREKSRNVFAERPAGALVVSADTIVLLNGLVIGKPTDQDNARDILRKLAGGMHEVWTGLSIIHRGKCFFDFARTRVFFEQISDQEINDYLDHEQYLDKAGAYAIQGRAAIFVKKIEGCYFNVMGFPLHLFSQMLKKIGLSIGDMISEGDNPI